MSNLLIDDQPVQILPKLATAIGLNEAVVVQQIHYWLKHNEKAKKSTHFIDGRWWTYNTKEEWAENFPWWSEDTVWRALKDLRRLGLVLTANYNKMKIDRTLWYTIDYDVLMQIELSIYAGCLDGNGQDAINQDVDMPTPIPETNPDTNPESVGQAPRPHAPATADDLMPAHLRGWIENNQAATGELLDTDQALAQLEANAPYKAAIIQASRDKRETGRNSAPLREAARRARELGFMPEQILAAFSMADGSYWRSTSFGRNGERPYVSNICQMIDEAASNKPLAGDELGAYNLLLRVKARTLQPHELNRPELNGAGKLALAVAKRNHGLPWLDDATPEAIRAAVAGVAQ